MAILAPRLFRHSCSARWHATVWMQAVRVAESVIAVLELLLTLRRHQNVLVHPTLLRCYCLLASRFVLLSREHHGLVETCRRSGEGLLRAPGRQEMLHLARWPSA